MTRYLTRIIAVRAIARLSDESQVAIEASPARIRVSPPHPSHSCASESVLRSGVSPVHPSQSCASESFLRFQGEPPAPAGAKALRPASAGLGPPASESFLRIRVIPAFPGEGVEAGVRRTGPGLRQTRAAPRPRVIGVAAVDVC